jgi:type VI secretion system protein ImpL
MSKRIWAFRQDSAIGRSLASSSATLREFQRAAEIRDTFFATGGLVPSMTLTIMPPPLPVTPIPAAATDATTAAAANTPSLSIKFEINGVPVTSVPGVSNPAVVQWPGSAINRAAITVTSDVPGLRPATIERNGPWSLFRLVEAGAAVARGDKIIVSYIVGGREINYQIGAASRYNPFTLPALREFRCPSAL